MGRSKVAIDVAGTPLAARTASVLTASGADPVVLVGASADDAAAVGLPSIADGWPDHGPLAGLATALHWAHGSGFDRVVVAACDQPLLDPGTISSLVAALGPAPGPAGPWGSVVRTADGRRHPFPSAWWSGVAPSLAALVDQGIRRADAAFDLGVVSLSGDGTDLIDVDHPDDLAAVVRRLRAGGPPTSP